MGISRKLVGTTALLSLLLFAVSGCGQKQEPTKPVAEGPRAITAPELAERFIKPVDGMFALVMNKEGELLVVDKDGKLAPRCQLCTPELEGKLGERCAGKPDTPPPEVPICNKTLGTTIKDVSTVTLVTHTGSDCTLVTKRIRGIEYLYDPCTGTLTPH